MHRYLFVCALLGALPATAATFYGFDQGQGEGTRIAHPNADAAEAAFLAALGLWGTEDFEDIDEGAGQGETLDFGITTALLSGTAGLVEDFPTGTNGFGRYPISGNRYFEVGESLSGFTLLFAAPVHAIGFYAVDVADFAGQLRVAVDGGSPFDVPHATPTIGGSVMYFGYLSATPFSSVQIYNGAPPTQADGFGFDDITAGTVVPEPGSLALLAGGLLAVLRRRRR